MKQSHWPFAVIRWTGLTLALSLWLLALPAQAKPEQYVIDPDHFSIGFLVRHIGYADTLGMFLQGSGSYTFDEETGQLSDLRVVIKTDSVFTNHAKRDEHLRGEDFLNVKKYPEMVYTASSAQRTGDRTFTVNGQLTLLGVTKPVTLKATWNKSDRYPILIGAVSGFPYVMGVSAEGSFKRSDFGMTYAVDNGWVGDQVELILEFEARRQ